MGYLSSLFCVTSLLILGGPASAQSIFIFDKEDTSFVFEDPEGGGWVTCAYGIQKALTANGYTYTLSETLPQDLTPYDIIFVVMGAFD